MTIKELRTILNNLAEHPELDNDEIITLSANQGHREQVYDTSLAIQGMKSIFILYTENTDK